MPEPKPKPKKTPQPQLRGPWWQNLLDGRWWTQLIQGWSKARDIAKNNYDLGKRHLALGNIGDAIFRFRLVTWLEPGHAGAWYQLGRAYLADGKPKEARKALKRSLLLRPNHEEAIYMLAISAGRAAPVAELPRKMPRSLAQEHFNQIAPTYTQAQLEQYQYEGHVVLAQAVRECMTQGRIDFDILELGVGTGLCGSLLRDVASRIVGVDMSAPMLAEAMKLQDAEGRRTYDALIHRELQEYLRDTPLESVDIVLSCGVASYIGDLTDFYRESARVLKNGGLLAFTADSISGHDFQFDPEAGRFRFSDYYLRQRATECGLREVMLKEAQDYPGHKIWVCVFTK